MPDIPFGPWLPDLPDHNNPGVTQALNVVPKTTRSYAPWRALQNVSVNALDERCLGASSAVDITGVAYTFAGDRTKLYRLLSASFADVSKALGYNTNTVRIDDASILWRFRQYRSQVDLMVATNFDDPIQSWTLAVSSAFGDLAPTTGPRAKYLDIVGNHLVLGNTFDAFDGERSSRVWFSPVGNPADDDWGNVNKLSDFQDLRSGGAITGVVGGEFGLIFCESAVHQMIFAGAPLIYDFNEILRSHGCIAPGSIAYNTNKVFYLSSAGFYSISGGLPVPIGLEKVDKTFFADIDSSNLGRVTANIDPQRNLYCVAYPGTGNTDGAPNRLLLYNYEIEQWALVNEELDVLVSTLSPGLTLEDLGLIYATVEDIPGTTDDPQWSGGVESFGAFNSSNRLTSFTGANKTATIETPEANIVPDGRAKRLKLRPLVDGGTASLSVGYRESQQAVRQCTTGQSVNTRSGLASFERDAGRYHTARLTMDGDDWSEAHGVSFEGQNAGTK